MGLEISKLKRSSAKKLARSRLQLPASITSMELGRLLKLNPFGKSKKLKKVLILSLDAAGKTTLLHYMKHEKVVNTIPTIGYNHEEIEYKNSTYSFWDVGGQDGIRQFWIHYYFQVHGLIFMVDSNDRERLDEARQVLQTVVNHLRLESDVHCPILILANKQDLSDVLTKEEIYDGLGLNRMTDIQTAILSCSIVNGVGIGDVFEWLHNEVKSS